MIAQSAAPAPTPAATAAAATATPAATDTLPADLLAALFDASALPFSQALLALHAPAPAASAKAPATSAPALAATPGTAATSAPALAGDGAPPAAAVGEISPADLLGLQFGPSTPAASLPTQALEALARAGADGAAAASAPAGIGTARPSAPGRAGKTATPAADASAAATAGSSALLALVLQWMQQQAGGAPQSAAAPGGADSGGPAAATADAGASAALGAAAGVIVAGTKAFEDASARIGPPAATAATVATVANAAGTTAAADAAAAANQPPVNPLAAVLPDTARRPSALAGDRSPQETHDTAGRPAGAAPPAADANAASAGLDLAAALRAATAGNPSAPERAIAVSVHDRHWPQALAAQVLILSNDKVQAATLRVSPEHLGPVEVRIDLQDARVNVTFSAAHLETRAALEQALPQLRAVLAGAGLALGQATVQQQARRESQHPGGAEPPGPDAIDQSEVIATVVRGLGMVDEYV